ncbi:hypothetical protein BJX65DRAFT_238048 [Aspergillus insuetus]
MPPRPGVRNEWKNEQFLLLSVLFLSLHRPCCFGSSINQSNIPATPYDDLYGLNAGYDSTGLGCGYASTHTTP